jgi:hypothetical protein
VATFPEKLQPILDMLATKAWRDAARDQDGEFLLNASDFAPGKSPESIHETLQALYKHARRWAPGLEVPFFVPPIRIDVVDAAGDFAVDEESYASVGVAAKFVGNDSAMLMILSHEACHHILMQSGLKRTDDTALDEITTDLAMFVCGFGELVLRSHSQVHRYGRKGTHVHLGYLSTADYRQAHEYVLAKRAAQGLPVRSNLSTPAAKGSSQTIASKQQADDGTVELWCGEAMCKRSFRTTLRHEGNPWPVRCPACGVHLYPSDVLKSASANELEPQRAELRMSSGGRLVESTSAALWRLAQPTTDARTAAPTRPARAAREPAQARSTSPAKVDGAAILAQMLEAASEPAQTPTAMQRPAPPAAVQRPEPPSRTPVKRTPILVMTVVLALVLVLVAAWIFFSSR